MRKFCKTLREHAMKKITMKKKEMIPLTVKKLSLMKSKKFITYPKTNLVKIKMIKIN